MRRSKDSISSAVTLPHILFRQREERQMLIVASEESISFNCILFRPLLIRLNKTEIAMNTAYLAFSLLFD